MIASSPATRPEFLQQRRRRPGPRLTEPVTRNLDIVAHTDLGGKPDGIQLAYQEAGGRSYLYLGHLWSGGVSIVDVTNPASPDVVGFVPTPNEHTWHIKVQVADMINAVVDRAIQVHGAMGLSDDTPLVGLHRMARALRFGDGPDEVHKLTIARRELGRFTT